jgi:hypothetical protein
MTPHEAAKLLDLLVDATPEQIETRFNELRAKLEDKVVKAPTPGLKAKYRESLEELTAAFEQLTLAADASSLPMLQRQKTEDGGPKTAKPAPAVGGPAVAGAPRWASAPPAVAKKKSGGGEFFIVAVIALAILGAGGWWVMKTRAENAEKARLAAEAVQKAADQKAEAERQAELARQAVEAKRLAEQQEKERLALEDKMERERVVAEEKQERERQERLFISLRTRMAEANVSYEALMRTEQAAERELSELKSHERDLSREAKSTASPESRRVAAQVRAAERHVDWLRNTLPSHPARIAKAKADELLSARAAEEASGAVATYVAALDQLKSDLLAAKSRLAISGPLNLTSNLDATAWRLVDAFGIAHAGNTPASLPDIAYGRGSVTFSRAGWPDLHLPLDHQAGRTELTASFPVGALRVESSPAGAAVYRGKDLIGTTPLDLPQLPVGPIELRIKKPSHRSQELKGVVENGRRLDLSARLEAAPPVRPERLLEIARENIALLPETHIRADQLRATLVTAMEIKDVDPAALRRLLDAHLATTREIPDPWARFQAAANIMRPAARYDLATSKAWADIATSTLPQLDADGRKIAPLLARNFWMHPESFSRLLKSITPWISRDNWTAISSLVELQSMAGNEAEAKRLVAWVDDYHESYMEGQRATGANHRRLTALRLALLRDDLPAINGELPKLSGAIDEAVSMELCNAFLRLGDVQHASTAFSLGNTLLTWDRFQALEFADRTPGQLEPLLNSLPETTAKPERSQGYLKLAELYADRGWAVEAQAALAKVDARNLVGNNISAYNRWRYVALLAALGQVESARQFLAQHPISFTRENLQQVAAAAPLFLCLDDQASFERAVQMINDANAGGLFTYIYPQAIAALGRMERLDQATAIVQRVTWQQAEAQSILLRARIRIDGEGREQEFLDQAQPGAERLRVASLLLQSHYERHLTR